MKLGIHNQPPFLSHYARQIVAIVLCLFVFCSCNCTGGNKKVATEKPGAEEKTVATVAVNTASFYVYKDASYRDNHYIPSGYMGDTGDCIVNENCKESPYSGETCIKITYLAKGKGPNECDYAPPCKWAGVYWLQPTNNWGTKAAYKSTGFDLSKYTKLTFYGRAGKETTIEFKVGGVNNRYGDSLKSPRSKFATMGNEWKRFEINLEGADLSYIIGGFCWVTNMNYHPGGAVFYIDEIRFE